MCEGTNGYRELARLPSGKVHRCLGCGVVSVSPQPAAKELAAAYQNFEAGEIARRDFDALVAQARPIVQADLTAGGLEIGKGLRFLDYGCGGGHFVQAAAELGMDAMGLDVDAESARFGRAHGLRIEVGDYRDCDDRFGTEPLAAVLMMHVLEHVPRPANVLRHFLARLGPGGILIIRVPDQASLPSRLKVLLRSAGIKTSEWGFVQPPIHLHGYSTSTFETLARSLGLEIAALRKISPLDQSQFPSTERYWQGLAVHRQVYRIARALGSGGHLLAILRRPALA